MSHPKGYPTIRDCISTRLHTQGSANCHALQHGTEFVHLPGIVESAESSPNAAKEAAHRIRKLLADPASSSPNVQYNAIMLMRILIENPGHTFSRNFDAKFVTTVRDLLRQGKDMYVKHFLSETLDMLESQRSWDEDLGLLLGMWMKEKASPKWRNVRTLLPFDDHACSVGPRSPCFKCIERNQCTTSHTAERPERPCHPPQFARTPAARGTCRPDRRGEDISQPSHPVRAVNAPGGDPGQRTH